jgi:serine/threonine protein kinase
MGLEVFAKSQADQGKYAGKVLGGRYLLTQTIGEGGEGVIYAGHLRYDPGMIYAFKVGYTVSVDGEQSDGLPTDPILRENAVLQKLHGMYIPRAVESGITAAGYPYSVRQLLPGLSLAKLLKRDPSPSFANCLLIGRALCRALLSIHEQGILHRDIKPGNIVIAPALDGDISLHLIDFAAGTPIVNEAIELGSIPAGTPAYMAPERALGRAGGVESDRYSVGAILYELFTSKAILGPDSWNLASARAYLEGDRPIPMQPVREVRPDLPPEIGHAITHLVSRNPEERHVDLKALEGILSAYLRKDQLEMDWFALPKRHTSQITAIPQDSLWNRVSRWFSNLLR